MKKKLNLESINYIAKADWLKLFGKKKGYDSIFIYFVQNYGQFE